MLDFRLDDNFVQPYSTRKPRWGFVDAGGNSLGELAFVRSYSRRKSCPKHTMSGWDDACASCHRKGKERWWEVCRRVVEGMFHEQRKWCEAHRIPWNLDKAQHAAQEAYDLLFERKWAPPGRGLAVMGTPFVHVLGNSAALQNCAFVSTAEMTWDNPAEPFTWLMEASMLGVGVGFDTKGAELGFRINQPVGTPWTYVVPDTREGWCESVRHKLESYLIPGKAPVQVDTHLVRDAGKPIKTFGGTAAGPGPLLELHDALDKLFTGRNDSPFTSRDIVDVMNIEGKCVVSGNVRRSAEVAIGEPDDKDYLSLKDYTLKENAARTGRDGWSWASNNSVFATVGMDYAPVIERVKLNGEPGLVWMDVTRSYGRLGDSPDGKDYRAAGFNPCLTYETKIFTADGRGAVEIGELADSGDDVPVFTIDDTGSVVIRDMRAPRKTGEQVPVMRVTLDDGSSFRATPNHKLVRKDGSYVCVSELRPGDSLQAVTRSQRKLHEIWGPHSTAKTSQYYWWLSEPRRAGALKAEHRVVASEFAGRKIVTGEVVHHRDYNALNNAPTNLEIMRKDDHDAHHRDRMLGDNNPMRREYDEKWWKRYRANMSAATAGEANGRYSGWTHDELRRVALDVTREAGGVAPATAFVDRCRELGAPFGLTKWRAKHLNGGVLGLLRWAAHELGYLSLDVDCDPRTARKLQHALASGYDAVIVDRHVVFTKRCEYDDVTFTTTNREVAFCSRRCASSARNAKGSPGALARGASISATKRAKQDRVKKLQVLVYKELERVLERAPQKNEWVQACKDAKLSAEISRETSPHRSWSELQTAAAGHNHRVVSVIPDGLADVYNGTVDDTHRYLIAAGEFIADNGGTVSTFVASAQCGEQPLESREMCTLVNLYPTNCNNLDDFERAIKYGYLYAKTVTLVATHWSQTNAIMQRNRRIGASFNGAWQFVEQHGWPELDRWMDDGFHEIVARDVQYSEWLCVRESIRHTTVKPDGTGGLLAGTTPGAHASPGSEYYLRRIRYGKDDPVVQLLSAAGYDVEPAFGNEATTVVVAFPIAGPVGVRAQDQVNVYEKASLAARMQRLWSDNSVSFTLTYDPKTEAEHLEHVIRMFEGQLKSLSFLAIDPTAYPQMPYEAITADQYDSYTQRLRSLDWRVLYDGDVVEDVTLEKGCTNDVCELPR